MKLTAVERFALQRLFSGRDATSISVREQLDDLEVVARAETGVGFFATIRLAKALDSVTRQQWDWNFKHRYLSHGGSFMCWRGDSNTLELEAVTHNGDWPDHFDPDDFEEA